MKQGVDFVLDCLERMWGGEIFVPKIPSYRILDVAAAIAPEARIEVVGIRPGEKLHEEMITATDALNTVEFDDYYVILPSTPLWDLDRFAAGERRRSRAARSPTASPIIAAPTTTSSAGDEIRDLIDRRMSNI